MGIRISPNVRHLFLIIALGVVLPVGAGAQEARFVQITDPHLFDGGQEEAENRSALAACVRKINERMGEGADYKFAVITGDIGVENLISEIRDGNRILEADPDKRERRLEEGAALLASILAESKIRVWLILPGNNDLFLENPDTQFYRSFVRKLKDKLPGLEVIDLCPEEPEVGKSEAGVYRMGALAFIGFNNASFKNDNSPERVQVNRARQLEYVSQVERRVKLDDVRSAYVFYHIPELDDPHIVLNFDTETVAKRKGYGGNPYLYSSWFVDGSVHEDWKEKVVRSPKVRGLFAGHYHDWRRDTYVGVHWMQTGDYLSGSLSKLHVCPPIAMKRQAGAASQARGFQEVAIDGTGKVGARVFWLNAADRTFDTEPPSLSAQLRLAQFHEGAKEWKEAESFYAEAAKNAPSADARDSALAGLRRVRDAQHSTVKDALGWVDPALAFVTLLLKNLLVILVVPLIILMVLVVRKASRAMVIDPFSGDEALSKRLAVAFPAVRAKIVTEFDQSVILPQAVLTVYPFITPRLEEMFPQEPLEVAGMTVPNLNVILKWFVRPRFRVTGGILPASPDRYVYTEVWRRQWWFDSRPEVLVTWVLPRGAGRAQAIDDFILDVYLTTYETL